MPKARIRLYTGNAGITHAWDIFAEPGHAHETCCGLLVPVYRYHHLGPETEVSCLDCVLEMAVRRAHFAALFEARYRRKLGSLLR